MTSTNRACCCGRFSPNLYRGVLVVSAERQMQDFCLPVYLRRLAVQPYFSRWGFLIKYRTKKPYLLPCRSFCFCAPTVKAAQGIGRVEHTMRVGMLPVACCFGWTATEPWGGLLFVVGSLLPFLWIVMKTRCGRKHPKRLMHEMPHCLLPPTRENANVVSNKQAKG